MLRIYTKCPLFIRQGNVPIPVIDTTVYERFLKEIYENKISFSHVKVEGGDLAKFCNIKIRK